MNFLTLSLILRFSVLMMFTLNIWFMCCNNDTILPIFSAKITITFLHILTNYGLLPFKLFKWNWLLQLILLCMLLRWHAYKLTWSMRRCFCSCGLWCFYGDTYSQLFQICEFCFYCLWLVLTKNYCSTATVSYCISILNFSKNLAVC